MRIVNYDHHALNPRPADIVLNGRYRIERELGRGGFGVVFLASDLHLHGRSVVVKAPTTFDSSAASVRTRRKFKAEIEALAKIQHPGVVSVLDSGATTSGRPYFVMEYVSGEPLSDWMRARARLSIPSVAELIGQCGAALAAVHVHNICHRDLKPQNILVSATGVRPHIKLIDFGIASFGDRASSQTAQVAGTLSYMAPEQLFGTVTAQSDIYSLAVIAYELLTGTVPFIASSPVELHRLQQDGRYLRPNLLCTDIPEPAVRILEKALSFKASQRFGSAREFTHLLTEALGGRGQAHGSKGRVRLRITTRNAVATKILHWIAAAYLINYPKARSLT